MYVCATGYGYKPVITFVYRECKVHLRRRARLDSPGKHYLPVQFACLIDFFSSPWTGTIRKQRARSLQRDQRHPYIHPGR